MSALPRFSPALALTAPLLGIAAVQTVDAAGYIKIGDIAGESTDPGHEDWIKFESFSWGVRCDPDEGGKMTRDFKPFVITKVIDKSSPKLMLACGVGEPIPDMTLTLNLAGRNEGKVYYKVELQDVLITSFQSGPSTSDQLPTEEVSLNYTKITWTYYPADGSDPVVVSRQVNPDATTE